MKRVELYGRVRHAVMIEGLSQREAARCFGIDPRTVRKMLSYSVPPGYVRTRPPVRPKLDPFIGIIDRILEEDKDRPKKQRHTSKRIFERLRDEYGFTGKITIVKDYICGVRQRWREMFVPLTHPPGHAQVDFGEALAVIGGVERKIHFLAMSLPHSDACFVKAYPGETTEAFCDGHVSGFSFFGGVPRSILYDNTRIAVARILGDGKRQRTRVFHELIEARDEKRLLRFQKQLAKYKLLIIDELGFVPLSKTGAELLFEVFSQRYEGGSTLVTSNLPFDEWTEVFGSERPGHGLDHGPAAQKPLCPGASGPGHNPSRW